MNYLVARILFIWQQFEQSEASFKVSLNAYAELPASTQEKYHVYRRKCHYRYAILLKKQHKYDLALDQFQSAFNIGQDNAKYIFECALCYGKLNEYDQAQEMHQKTITMDPENEKYVHDHARFLYENGKEDLEHAQKVTNLFLKLIEAKPDNTAIRYWYGRLLQEKHQYEDAKTCYKMLIEAEPTNTKWISQYAICCSASGELDQAKQLSLKTIELSSSSVSKTVEYRRIYAVFLKRKCKDFKAALRELEVGLELDPSNAECTIEIARCYKKLEDVENARKYYLKAIEIDSKNTAKYCNLYAIFLKDECDDFESAKLYFMKAIEINPNDCNFYYEYARFMRDDVRDYNESEMYYLKCLEIDPKYERANHSYGYLLYLMGKYEKAMEYIKIGIELNNNPKSIWPYFYQGLVYKAIGDKEMADQALLKAIELITTRKERDRTKKCICRMKSVEVLNMDYYDRFERLSDDKFKNCDTE